jgi:tRNA threonylcarbamoyladenosine biosynthesis protein TsaB
MLVLGVDTSTNYLAAAVCDGNSSRVEYSLLANRRHAERIVETIDRILADAGLALAGLDLLAVTSGPGSFTGLRIGVSAMKGLAEGAGLPLAGVPTLDAMTRQFPAADGLVCPLLDARMDEVYGAVYRFSNGAREAILPAMVGRVEDVLAGIDEPVTVFGEGARSYAKRIAACCPSARIVPELGDHARGWSVVQEAIAAVNAGANTDAALVRPVYLRQSQPEEARRRAREAATA